MLLTKMFFCSFGLYAISAILMMVESVESRSLRQQYPITSDVVVTKWPSDSNSKNQENTEDKAPGWMRRQLMRFGEVTSRIGNSMGTHATKITSAIDKVCEIVKTVIPLLAAVCHVGQFKFCTATESAPGELADALSPTSLDLDSPDRRR